jgi:hypothetical protein
MTPLPPDQRTKFFVFVIESPSDADLYHRRSEGDIVKQAVELNGIGCIVKTAISRDAFLACLKIGLAEAMKQRPGFLPLLHISAHGDTYGIRLSDGYSMPWTELKEHLRPVNEALEGSLVVCMSSCEGYAGVKMAMHPEEADLPYFALIGCGDKPTWGDTAVAYATLYHQLWRGEHIEQAVRAMRIASGNNHFFLEHAEQSKKAYIQHLNTVNLAQAKENLGVIAESQAASPEATMARVTEPDTPSTDESPHSTADAGGPAV